MDKHDITEDTTSDSAVSPLSRSTERRAQTPRAKRNVDHISRPGALPPAPGRLRAALASTWFPLVLGLVLLVLTEQVLTDGPLLAVDRWTRATVQGWAASLRPWPWVDRVAERWTDIGLPEVSGTALALVTVVTTVWQRSWRPLATGVLAAVVLFGTVIPGKILIGRPGPEGVPVASGDWGWFPSGHTATAAICLGTAALLAAGVLPRLRALIYTATAFVCVGVGFCLIWRNYHWLWDVVASGCLTGITLWCLDRWIAHERQGSR